MKILVVDTWSMLADALIRRNRNAKLSAASLHAPIVEFEPDYERALELVQDVERYDAVVVDPYPADGPTNLGHEIIKRLNGTRVAVVVVTASWRIAECVECMQLGAWDFITKTQAPEKIADLLDDSLDKSVAVRKPPQDIEAKWVHDNLDHLCRDYGGLWIAVEGEAVWASAETYEDLDDAVKQMSLTSPRYWRIPAGWVGRYGY